MKKYLFLTMLLIGTAAAAGFYTREPAKPEMRKMEGVHHLCYNGFIIVSARYAAFYELDATGKPVRCPL